MPRLGPLVLSLLLIGGCRPNPETPPNPGTPPNPAAPTNPAAPPKSAAPPNPAAPPDDTLSGPLEAIDWQSLDGQLVTLRDMVIVDTFSLLRRGQLTLARDRLVIPTETIDPNDAEPAGTSSTGGSNVGPVIAQDKRNKSATVVVDDLRDDSNVFPPPLLPTLGDQLETVRLGSRIPSLTGTVAIDRGRPIIRISTPLSIEPAARPARPDLGDPNLGDPDWTVASFNVLNFFSTLDDGRNQARGADSSDELERQTQKVVAAIIALDADVIGLMEIENSAASEPTLLRRINDELGDQRYVGCGIPEAFGQSPGGGDAIRVGIIYRADRVKPLGRVQTIQDEAFRSARAPLLQTFQRVGDAGGSPITIVVNHFKSKGGAADADIDNQDKGDGQGAYNAARRSQAMALSQYLQDTDMADDRVLIIGDLNAYAEEDPIDALRSSGLIDLHQSGGTAGKTSGPPAYSYVYYGQCGRLDHALATSSLAGDVTATKVWHINADEPRFLDYNQEYNPPPLFRPDPWRSSDHDPVLIGIRD